MSDAEKIVQAINDLRICVGIVGAGIMMFLAWIVSALVGEDE